MTEPALGAGADVGQPGADVADEDLVRAGGTQDVEEVEGLPASDVDGVGSREDAVDLSERGSGEG